MNVAAFRTCKSDRILRNLLLNLRHDEDDLVLILETSFDNVVAIALYTVHLSSFILLSYYIRRFRLKKVLPCLKINKAIKMPDVTRCIFPVEPPELSVSSAYMKECADDTDRGLHIRKPLKIKKVTQL